MQPMTFKDIKLLYPDQWVLLGDPQLDDPNTLGSIASKLVSGIVLLADKDKRQLALHAHEYRKGFSAYTCVYTGEIPKNRKFWL